MSDPVYDSEDDKRAWDRHNIDETADIHESGGAGGEAGGGEEEARSNLVSLICAVQDPAHSRGHQYGNITIGGSAPVQIGDVIHYSSYTTFSQADTPEGLAIPTQANFTGAYAYSSLQPVAAYVPRFELQRRLREQLAILPNRHSHEMRTAVVWGLGGAGKSQLVLNHVQGHRPHYQGVFWIEAGSKETIERDYIQIYKQIRNPFHPSASYNSTTIPVEDAIAGVKSWLQGQEKRCLWVMDSADEVDDDTSELYIDLAHYLPEASQLDRIVTTRSSRIQGMSSQGSIEVKEMTEQEAVDLFRQCANLLPKSEHDEHEVLTIVKELGCLALAVTLAGSYVREDPEISLNLGLYLSEFQQRRAQLLSQRPHRLVHQYGESVLSTWEISYSTIRRQSPMAVKLLNVLAFLNFDDVFLDLFVERSTRQQSPSLGHGRASQPQKPRWVEMLSSNGGIVNHNSIKSALKTLGAYSLISWRSNQLAYGMHKLVHAWGHDRLDTGQKRAWSSAVLELLSVMIYDCRGDLNKERRLVPHVMANFIAVSSAYGEGYQIPTEDRINLGWVADLLHRLGRWDDKYSVRLFLCQVVQIMQGLEHPDTLTSMSNLATVLSEQGKYEQAEEMHRQTLNLSLTVLGLEHTNTLMSMNNLATVLRKQGKYEQAEGILRQTLELRSTVLGVEHPDTLGSMNNLATVLGNQGKYEEAEKMHRQELKLSSTVLGVEHPDTLTSMNNLALVLCDQGKYEQAEEMQQRTLELSKVVLGVEHPDTLGSMNNLATVLRNQGKYEQAEKMQQRTLELSKVVLGVEHPDTLTSMDNLALVLADQGKYEQAISLYTLVTAI
ncbi:hypothetical protein H2198_008471 [Neophaeococcomyces mojaviensis]|uniref:Uncharacterized protein n=1 Tax=Neophaeococcomyces mojaviensis TaxID=3383035 RepID=A0ACC2ZX97_9EURO|nr:hypothetical protein H2198_008471 [Knufia sp. JES_112]